jgi:hypothetical protein
MGYPLEFKSEVELNFKILIVLLLVLVIVIFQMQILEIKIQDLIIFYLTLDYQRIFK